MCLQPSVTICFKLHSNVVRNWEVADQRLLETERGKLERQFVVCCDVGDMFVVRQTQTASLNMEA